MNDSEISAWLADVLPRHTALTDTVVGMLHSLFRARDIDFLTVSGRTKESKSLKEKIGRKGYSDPKSQLTDISGVRAVFYLESDLAKASRIIEEAFTIDSENSLNKDALLSVDQIGYRSIHYVCELGEGRTTLPEYSGLTGLRFEIQLRTVLQHAWAELSHDRNYKFSGKLPRTIERELFLYAGMLEIADRGFDSLARSIDKYSDEVSSKTKKGNLDIPINSLSLEHFVHSWSETERFDLRENNKSTANIVQELSDFGISTVAQLKEIVPHKYAEIAKSVGYSSTLQGLVRDWMVMSDFLKYRDKAWKRSWFDNWEPPSSTLYEMILGAEAAKKVMQTFDDRRN